MTNIKLDFEQRQQAERMAENGDQLDQCFELVWSRAEIERLNQNIERRQAEKEKLQGIMVQMVETGQVTQVEPPVQRGVPLRFEFAEHCGCCVRNKITLDVFGAKAASREASSSHRLAVECEKCHRGMIITLEQGIVQGFQCSCGHYTKVRDAVKSAACLCNDPNAIECPEHD